MDFANTSAVAYSGSQAANMDGNGLNELIATVDLSGKTAANDVVYLNFMWREYEDETSPEDKIYVRGSDADTWLVLYDWQQADANDNYKSSGNLALHTALASGGQEFSATTQIKFSQTDNGPISGKDGLSIDDVIIYAPANDVGVTAITSPVTAGDLSDAGATLTVKLNNWGTNHVSNLPIKALITNPEGDVKTLNETISAIPGGDSVSYTFSTSLETSVSGTYQIEVIANLTGDEFAGNNTLKASVFKPKTVASFPYFENFESGDGAFQTTGMLSSWEYGTPANTTISGAADGNYAWVTNLTGDYNDNEWSYLDFPYFDFSTLTTDPIISFEMLYEFQSCCDKAWMEISLDSGTTFSILGDIASNSQSPNNNNWYNDSSNKWRGSTDGYVFVSHELPGTAGLRHVRLRLVFNSNSGLTYEGVAIDRVRVATELNLYPEITVSISDRIETAGFVSFDIDLDKVFKDRDDDILVYTVSSSDESIASGNISDTFLTVSEVGLGTATISVTATDPKGTSVTEVFNIRVNSVPAVAAAIADEVRNEGFSAFDIDLSGVFADADGDTLGYTVSSDNSSVANVSLSSSTLTITEVALGTATILVTATDPYGKSVKDEFNVVVNSTPVLTAVPLADQVLVEGFSTLNINISGVFSDADGNTLTYTASSDNSSVVAVSTTSSAVVLTEAGLGSATISVTATDPYGKFVTDEFNVVVNAVPTVANAISDQELTEAFSSLDIDISTVFADANNHALTYTVSVSNESVVTASLTNSAMTISEVGLGTSQVEITATDPYGYSESDVFDVVVSPITGLEDLTDTGTSLEAYPVPATDYLSVHKLLGKNTRVTIRITDINGRLLENLNLGEVDEINKKIDISRFNPGLLILSVSEDNVWHHVKVIKE